MNAVIENAAPVEPRLPVPDPVTVLESELYARSRSGEPSPLSRLLEVYWRALPAIATEGRLQLLQRVGETVRHGLQDRGCLAVPLLGDPDERVVFAATLAYAARGPVPVERRRLAMEQVLEWIRRGLAVRRSAAFAALLSLGDPEIEDRLRPLRLGLSSDEFDAVRASLDAEAATPCTEFMAEWAALLAPMSA